MSDQPDLFAPERESTTCGTCQSCLMDLLKRVRYCAESYQDVDPDAEACGQYEARR